MGDRNQLGLLRARGGSHLGCDEQLGLGGVTDVYFYGGDARKVWVGGAIVTELYQRLFNAVPGGMALSVVGIGVLLSASTGIIGASVVLLGLLAMPPMLARGYQPELAAGTVAAVGSLGILVPPSIMLVMMADRLALPVGPLFLGALIPGLLLAGSVRGVHRDLSRC